MLVIQFIRTNRVISLFDELKKMTIKRLIEAFL